jgi:hypothetical protein
MTLRTLDMGDIQASLETIVVVNKTPIENRGPASDRQKGAPTPQVPEPRASYSCKKSNARVFLFASQFFSIHSWGIPLFLVPRVNAARKRIG